MRYKTTAVASLFMLVVASLLFSYYEMKVNQMVSGLAIHPRVQEFLKRSAEDKKKLASLDPDSEQLYRDDFDQIMGLHHNLEVLRFNWASLRSRFRLSLWLALGLILIPAIFFHWYRERLFQQRLAGLQEPLSRLAGGDEEIHVSEKSSDVIGTFARMIEQTSGRLMRQSRQIRALDHLSAWQETTRRHAHEIRTPLQAAYMETENLYELAAALPETAGTQVVRVAGDILEELECLKRFTRAYTSFARLPDVQLTSLNLVDLIHEFCDLFSASWSNLKLVFSEQEPLVIQADRDMVRQVLVNLCSNSSLALGEAEGLVQFEIIAVDDEVRLGVRDNGPGIPRSMRDRLFQPYVTTRAIGEGMGLGLAISRKIMLDHGGDLTLDNSWTQGAGFLLRFPKGGDT